jgi:hypothetical protein
VNQMRGRPGIEERRSKAEIPKRNNQELIQTFLQENLIQCLYAIFE